MKKTNELTISEVIDKMIDMLNKFPWMAKYKKQDIFNVDELSD